MGVRTARQVKTYDIIGSQPGGSAIFGVLSVFEDKIAGTFFIRTISSRGVRGEVEYGGNEKLEVLRPSEGEVDPTNNPYWWGLEAEREAAEDARAYASKPDAACDCSWHSRCWAHREEDARNVAHLGANAVQRALHRAHND